MNQPVEAVWRQTTVARAGQEAISRSRFPQDIRYIEQFL